MKPICFRCGSELINSGCSDAATTAGETIQYEYHCPHCGDEYEQLELADEEKDSFAYWQKRTPQSDESKD